MPHFITVSLPELAAFPAVDSKKSSGNNLTIGDYKVTVRGSEKGFSTPEIKNFQIIVIKNFQKKE